MDRQELQKLYEEKLGELEAERAKLGEMFTRRVSVSKPLTDEDILKQNECCGNLSLEVTRLKDMLKENGEK